MTNSSGIRLAGKITTLLTLMIVAPTAFADMVLNLRRGVTDISQTVYELHMLILWACVAIAIVVFGVMIVSIILHRRSRGAEAAKFSHSTKAELVWTIIPVIILIWMAVPAAKTLVVMEDFRDSEMTIKVTGYQWRWHYAYLGTDVDFFSSLARSSNIARQLRSGVDPFSVQNYLLDVDKPLVVPVDTKIRVLITANDVLHSWWMPSFGVKKDAIPGFINEVWFKANETGTYRGQCAELCGRGHGFMPIVVDVLSKQDYAAWIDAKGRGETVAMVESTTDAEAPAVAGELSGEELYNVSCSACHQANGQGLPPAFPSLVDSAMVNGPVANHIDIVMNGRVGTAMIGFSTQLGDAELAAIINYERNAWGLNSGDTVQASDIAAAR
ncbi:MAG: cytochrome c oxidase subunit II [Gammaproteobacteria bacterium]|nr:cytochrome c oxidase subunit II [Gammaproteobacteria bacterium]MCZ6687684.1 cytochrome c oxidase subunit II [Gammaproteobacteria bacterium]MCZ6763231.1 cytochrome c oxidase subunit II [Gammaproteobacteria bacterium]MCZ6879950.1 cytochrome c oxidase subunit II [Gammaproteobacteria bacterium]TDJ13305.1 MAG: cytochrome c oxidase subunit II [Gammaproteobacteria bacterium]